MIVGSGLSLKTKGQVSIARMDTPDRNGKLEDWKITGFDCISPEPDILVLQPNKKRSYGQIGYLLAPVLVVGPIAAVVGYFLLHSLGLLHFAGDPMPFVLPDALIFKIGLVLFFLLLAICVVPSLYALLWDEIWHRYTPIILDRRTDRLLYGGKVVCRLSEIARLILLQVVISGQAQRGKGQDTVCGVSIELKDGRTVPRRLLPIPYLRYGLGPQEPAIQHVLYRTAEFIGTELYVRSEKYIPPSGKGM